MDNSSLLATLAGILALMGVPVGLLFRTLVKTQEDKDRSHEAMVKLLLDSLTKLQEQNEDLRRLMDRTVGVAEGTGQVAKDLTTSRRR